MVWLSPQPSQRPHPLHGFPSAAASSFLHPIAHLGPRRPPNLLSAHTNKPKANTEQRPIPNPSLLSLALSLPILSPFAPSPSSRPRTISVSIRIPLIFLSKTKQGAKPRFTSYSISPNPLAALVPVSSLGEKKERGRKKKTKPQQANPRFLRSNCSSPCNHRLFGRSPPPVISSPRRMI